MTSRSMARMMLTLTLTLGSILTSDAQTTSNEMGLKDFYAEYFPVGVSISPKNLQTKDSVLILREFNSITPENVMKMGPIHPMETAYRWMAPDRLVQFARLHQLKMRGHTLCWHQQVGDWMFQDDEGNVVSKEILLQRLQDHIYSVASRYDNDIYAWDVVNEAVSDDQDVYLRDSRWLQICGSDFIPAAFGYAHTASPDALLFYNDYDAVNPPKRDKIIRLLSELIEQGVPVHGIGIQGHWSIYGPTERELRDALDAYKKLGLQIQITELDVSVYPGENGRRDMRKDETDVLTREQEMKQAEQYAMFFRVFRDYRDVITGVTFWNLTDADSWLNTFPVRGRRNYPLLFDRNGQKKKAYTGVTVF